MDVLKILIPLTLVASTPLIIAALGGLFSEKSGVVNIALEGMMTIGAFAGATVVALIEPAIGAPALIIGALFGALIGALFGLLHAYISVTIKADQIISGTAINMLTLGLALYLTNVIFNSGETPGKLSQAQAIGNTEILWITAIAFLLVILTWVVVYKTPWGLRLRGVGENPSAIDSMGISVSKLRYQAVIISGALAGLAGMSIVLTTAGRFAGYTVSGKGFIALAVLIFGRWNPWGVLFAALFFGFTTTLSTVASILLPNIGIPTYLFDILPYVITIITLVIFSRSSAAPAAIGKPFIKE